jgi:4-hydroxybenzoate polyprenyltransferase
VPRRHRYAASAQAISDTVSDTLRDTVRDTDRVLTRWPAGLVRACHPEPTAAVTVVTGAFAWAAGRGSGTVWVVAAVLAGQLSVGWSNDAIDRTRDLAARRRDKPVATGAVPVRVVAVAAAVALVLVVPLSFAGGWRAAIAHLLGVTAAWSYNLGVKATVLSAVPFAVAFGALPAFVVLGLPGRPFPPWWMTAAGGLLGVGAHFMNVVPDIDDDLRSGVAGLPHRFGRRGSTAVAGLLLTAASCILALGPGPDALGVVAVAATVALVFVAASVTTRRPNSRWPFRIAMVVALIDVVLLIIRGRALTG